MKDFINRLYQNHALIYKVSLFIVTTIAIVYLFPKGGHFRFDIHKGKIWQSDNLYAPFDFAIEKSPEEIEKLKQEIESNKKLYFTHNKDVIGRVKSNYSKRVASAIPDSLFINTNKRRVERFGEQLLNSIYSKGFLENDDSKRAGKNDIIILREGNEVKEIAFGKLITPSDISTLVDGHFNNSNYRKFKSYFKSIYTDVLEADISYDSEFTEKVLDEELKKISFTKGMVSEDERIISRGDVVEGTKYEILNSLKNEYQSQLWNESNYNWIVFGYIIL